MSAPTSTGISADAANVVAANEAIRAAAARIAASGESALRPAAHPVNQPMIDHWLEALNSHHLPTDGSLAPPAMIQVWTMPGLRGRRADDDPLAAMMSVLDQAGYPSVVATNCEQTYHRYLRVGERVSVSARLGAVTGPKRTALGEGWFVTTHSTWFVADEPVAEMVFRVLKFRPPRPKPAPELLGAPLRPVISRDTEFFWQGAAAKQLRVQRCEDCGALRHPPGPRCANCGSQRRGYLVATGIGTIYSYVVHHHPPVSGRAGPFVVALIELPEGVRMLGELLDVDPLDPAELAAVRIGCAVELLWQRVDDALTLPAWRMAGPRRIGGTT
jgi:uncharacterized OB-fold protein